MSSFGYNQAIDSSHNQATEYRHQNSYDNWRMLLINQITTYQRIAEHSCSYGEIHTAGNQAEGNSYPQKRQVIGIVHNTQNRRILPERRALRAEKNN